VPPSAESTGSTTSDRGYVRQAYTVWSGIAAGVFCLVAVTDLSTEPRLRRRRPAPRPRQPLRASPLSRRRSPSPQPRLFGRPTEVIDGDTFVAGGECMHPGPGNRLLRDGHGRRRTGHDDGRGAAPQPTDRADRTAGEWTGTSTTVFSGTCRSAARTSAPPWSMTPLPVYTRVRMTRHRATWRRCGPLTSTASETISATGSRPSRIRRSSRGRGGPPRRGRGSAEFPGRLRLERPLTERRHQA